MPRGSNPRVRQVWRERLRRFQNSTTTVARFCEAEQVSTASFYAWRKRLAQERDGARAEAAFLAVKMPLTQAEVCVQLPGGATLELREGLSRERLQHIIAATVQATTAQAAAERMDNSMSTRSEPSGARRQAC